MNDNNLNEQTIENEINIEDISINKEQNNDNSITEESEQLTDDSKQKVEQPIKSTNNKNKEKTINDLNSSELRYYKRTGIIPK